MLHGASEASYCLFPTAIGTCGVAWGERGLLSVQLPCADDDATRRRLLANLPGAREARASGEAKAAIDAMRAHLAGDLRTLDELRIDDSACPEFHRRVYRELRRVGPGETIGYGELATRVGSPGAARAVGQAVGKNPFPIVVPCQRVLASGSKTGGFSAYGGVRTKHRMLAIEGVTLGARIDPAAAAAHLSSADERLARLVAQVGPPRIRKERTKSTFEALAESIVYQQLAGAAAATIYGRLSALFPLGRLAPEHLLGLKDGALRGAGISRPKMLALRDLAQKTLDGTVPAIEKLHGMSDDVIVERLSQVRGIGRWTVEMLLIFRLGRPDVLPVADFGVRHGFKVAYGRRSMPSPKDLARWGERWRPHRTAASWYMWRAVDLARKRPPTGRA
ncbi:MAG TPA: methylated-DNA--[protein]-cysteine S-methyltransferase [Polyangiaceae bacterium]